jgi:uncharacterized protein
MNCPKCNSVMQKVSVEDIEVDCCGTCEGIWFDLREHDHLKLIRGSEDRIDLGDPAKLRGGEAMDAVRDINCPRCGVKLVKLSMPDQTHIKYEQCATCGGAFLDAGEFTDFKHLSVSERAKRFLQPLK